MGKREQRIRELVQESGARCTCGIPVDRTARHAGNHSEQCEMTSAWDDAVDEYDDEHYDHRLPRGAA